MQSLANDIAKLTAAELVFGALVVAALFLFVVIVRSIARTSWVSHWAWRESRARPLSVPRRKVFGMPRRRPLEWIKRRVAGAVFRLAEQPLSVTAFEGAEKEDAAAVSSALSSAMTRIGSVRRSGVDSVTAPIAAETATEAVADAVKATPAGGELAAALLKLGSVLLARGVVQLNGHTLPPSVGGPGLALTLAKGKGRVIERLTLRAVDFEPPVGVGPVVDAGDETDRMLRVATAGAVWTHFKILEEVWGLTDEELEMSVRTRSWLSYALTRIGIEGNERHGPDFARALYAKAVEADPGNLVAQFNLASVELKDELLSQVRLAGEERLDNVHETLHGEHTTMKIERGGSPAVQREQELLSHDPLCYQVFYKRVAAKLNNDIVLEATREKSAVGGLPPYLPRGHWRFASSSSGADIAGIDGLSLGDDDMAKLTKHLWELESTLEALERTAYGWWPASIYRRWTTKRSKQRAELRGLLLELEGPMLVLWAMVKLRLGSPVRESGHPQALVEPKHPPRRATASWLAPGSRGWLIDRLEAGLLSLGEAVDFARSAEMSPSARTRLNLACWYADLGWLSESLRELALGMECGGELVGGWLLDTQLRRLTGSKDYADEVKKLKLRYPPPARARAQAQNGNGRAKVSKASAVAPLIADLPGG